MCVTLTNHTSYTEKNYLTNPIGLKWNGVMCLWNNFLGVYWVVYWRCTRSIKNGTQHMYVCSFLLLKIVWQNLFPNWRNSERNPLGICCVSIILCICDNGVNGWIAKKASRCFPIAFVYIIFVYNTTGDTSACQHEWLCVWCVIAVSLLAFGWKIAFIHHYKS